MQTPTYLDDDWLLHTPAARELYHGYAEGMPIIDYHCHLPPAEIAQDKRWGDVAELWLAGDHYKWRGMRSNGVDERLVTGDASWREKFDAYAACMPYFVGNPLFDWTHLELARFFGIKDILSPATADSIWDRTKEMLQSPDFSARGFMSRSNVRVVCTTDDPCDDLAFHAAIRAEQEAGSDFKVKVLPAWRPDRATQVANAKRWNEWVDRLAAAAGTDISTFDGFLAALRSRHDFFAKCGSRLSDYGIPTVPDVALPTTAEMSAIFDAVRAGRDATPAEADSFLFGMLVELGRMDAESDWTWQLHYGPIRNNSSRIFKLVGPDAGCDSIDDQPVARGLSRLLDTLDSADLLPRTIIYNLNPRDNVLLGAMIGNFQRGPTAGKIQLGSGWWFNDQKRGMRDQMEFLSQLGLLSRFVGMLTDSRSFTSYPRHEYFRRILCDLLGSWMEAGDIPRDLGLVGQIVRDISYGNAERYFGF
ncbi:MAG: glucuronate isomerase [Kiritimatiellae bacterium]|nr:glucuronate isomerase [Kiritimatiellia bacterium]